MSFRRCAVAVVVFACLAGSAVRAEDGGGLVGWVESTRGAPVAGAVISVFGKRPGHIHHIGLVQRLADVVSCCRNKCIRDTATDD